MHKGLQRKRDNYLNNLHVLHLKNELVHFEVRCSRVADLWTSLFVNAKIVERQETVSLCSNYDFIYKDYSCLLNS